MSTAASPPAGWYPDPGAGANGLQRWWDGQQWTDHVHDPFAGQGQPGGVVSPGRADGTQPTDTAASDRKIPRFGARKAAEGLQAELAVAHASLEKLGALDHAQIRLAIAEQRALLGQISEQVRQQQFALEHAKGEILVTADLQILQEVGVYEYRHPLSDAAAYQGALKQLKDGIKVMARVDGGAVTGATDWTVNGSVPQGRKMVRETSKLMLRAYNAEADNLVRGLKPYKLDTAVTRLAKVVDTITKLGQTMSIQISPQYHYLRVQELELTADYLAKKEEEKERDREARDRLREERKVQQEMERERARLEKEQTHYQNALRALEAKGDDEAAARMRAQLEDLEKAIEDVDYRAANIRAGYV